MLLKSRQKQFAVEEVAVLLNDIADKRQEHFIVLTYDASMRLIDKHLVFLGTVNTSICHPREVFAVAITDAASSIVIGHNHPSGDPYPSADDRKTTQQLVAASLIIGIPIMDHIIVSISEYFSFSHHDLL